MSWKRERRVRETFQNQRSIHQRETARNLELLSPIAQHRTGFAVGKFAAQRVASKRRAE